MFGWHFTGNTLRDGRPIPAIGEWLIHDGPIVPCESGLHMSEHPLDALGYAPGPMLHRVKLEGELIPHGDPVDKWVGRRRKILASRDVTDTLRQFARVCALDVLDKWGAPDVVRRYLETGDESLRSLARSLAWPATWDAVWSAAWSAARTAAWDVAWSTQRDRFASLVAEKFAVTEGTE
jgi:hypothetical protein